MLFALVAVIGSITAIALSTFGVSIEYKSLKRTEEIGRFLEHTAETQPHLAEELDEYFLEEEEGVEGNRLQAWGLLLGSSIRKGLQFSGMQKNSVEARHFNNVDAKVFDALKDNDPQVRLVSRVLEQIGLGDLVNEKDLPYVMQKYGHLLGVANNPSSGARM